MKKPSQKISDLKLKIPNPPDPVGTAYIFSNNLLFISGQLSIDADGKMTTGKIGKELNLEQGQEAAYLCALNIIAQVKKACKGDIDKVNKCIKLTGYINSSDNFTDQPKVINKASKLISNLFGKKMRCTLEQLLVQILYLWDLQLKLMQFLKLTRNG